MYCKKKETQVNKIRVNRKVDNHRAVASIIATLLLMIIAVVGGTIIFVFAQQSYNQDQISGTIPIELIKILGYDTRDVSELRSHSGLFMKADTAGIPDGFKAASERITIYVQNHGIQKAHLSELRFAGTVYEFIGNANTLDKFVTNNYPSQGKYVILANTPDVLINSNTPEIPAGKTASIVLGLDQNFKIGRNQMIKLTTINGFVAIKQIMLGNNYVIHGVSCVAKEEEGGECGCSEVCADQGGGGDSGSSGGSGSGGSEGSGGSGSSGGSSSEGSEGSGSSGSSGGSSTS